MKIAWIVLFALVGLLIPLKRLQSQNYKEDKLHVIMTTDFPPIGVVKGGDAPN